MNLFAKRLKQLRQERGITQEKLADKLKVATKTVQRWERGEHAP